MFKRISQFVANELDSKGELVPVHSFPELKHFRPLCLVTRTRKAVFQTCSRYKKTEFSLEHVLLPGGDHKSTESPSLCGDSYESVQFTMEKSTTDRVDGSASLNINPVSMEMNAATSMASWCSLKLEKSYIELSQLEALKIERKMNMNHSLIHQLRRAQQDLYVVHETVEALEETSYKESTKAKGTFMTQIYAKFCAKGTRESKKSITIPKGCALACRAIQLDITDTSWGLVYVPPKNRSVFRSDGEIRVMSSGPHPPAISLGFQQGKFGALQIEVKENCQVLSKFSSALFTAFLKALKAVMRDGNIFQELTHKMEAVLEAGGCELKTESPDLKDLLSKLQFFSEPLLLKVAQAITYVLDAFEELTEDQLLLLLESWDEKIVPQQLKLVESILEQDIEVGKRHFRIDTSLLAFSGEKEQELTLAMVQQSGVTLQKDGSAACTEEAFSAVAALYVPLYVLSLRSNSYQASWVLPRGAI